MVLLVIIELIPVVLGIMFVVNIMEEYKQFGLIVTKLNEGEQCMIQQQFKNDDEQEANTNEICIDENILRERELLVLKRERILDEREEFLKKREEQFNERKMKSVSYTNSSEQYAKKLKTRFR